MRERIQRSECTLPKSSVLFALSLGSTAGREYGGKAMAGFGRSITTTALFLGTAAVITGCAQTGTRQSMLRKQSTHDAYSSASSNPTSETTIVPEKYGLVERHDIVVDPSRQQSIYLKMVYTLASVDAIENSNSVKSVSRMTDYKGAYEADCPDVSPDGNSVVYQLLEEDGSVNLWTMSAKTGLRAVRKTEGSKLNFSPTYASDGARIVFSSNRSGPSGNVWALGTSGGLRPVTDSPEADMWAHEDPIGQSTIAFTRFQLGDSRGSIWIYDRNSYSAAQLREGRQSRISPNGKKIAFSAFDAHEGHWNIWVMNVDGSGAKALTNNNADNTEPAWHPSGNWITFASNAGTASANLRDLNAEIKLHNFDIWMTELNGSRAIQLTVNGSDDHNPVFAPDGKVFYFSSNRGQAIDLTAQNLTEYRQRGRTITMGGVEFPVASGRDLWRAELSQEVARIANKGTQARHAGVR